MTIKQRTIAICIMLLSFYMSSCGSAAPEKVAAIAISPTKIVESTNAPQPIAAATETPELPAATTSWKEIPIFPEAFTGYEDMGDYQFTTTSPARIIIAYYQQEMIKLGWEIREDMMASSSSDLAFNKGNTFVFFMIRPEGDNNTVYIHAVEN